MPITETNRQRQRLRHQRFIVVPLEQRRLGSMWHFRVPRTLRTTPSIGSCWITKGMTAQIIGTGGKITRMGTPTTRESIPVTAVPETPLGLRSAATLHLRFGSAVPPRELRR